MALRDPHDCAQCESCSSTPFCDVSKVSLGKLSMQKVRARFSKGQQIFGEGDQARGTYCISKGLVRLEHLNNRGNLRILNLLKPGDLLGARTLFTDELYAMSAVAEDDTEVCFISRCLLLSLVEKEPSLALKLLKDISIHSKRNDIRLFQSSQVSAAGRVAGSILFLKSNFDSKKWSRAEIAAWAGTTTETAVRCLTKFENDHLVELKGHSIKIINKPKLEKLSKG